MADTTTVPTRSYPCLSSSASAPGKLILFGEHAVVHNQPAIAACLSDLRIKVDIMFCTKTDDGNKVEDSIQVEKNGRRGITIDLPDLKPDPLRLEIPSLESIKVDQLIKRYECGDDNNIFVPSNLKELLEKNGPPSVQDVNDIHYTLTKLFNEQGKGRAEESGEFGENETIISAITPLVYLVNVIILPVLIRIEEKKKKIVDTVETAGLSTYDLSIMAKSQGLPLGAGLGSSAAFSVAASAALYKLHLSLLNNIHENMEVKHHSIISSPPQRQQHQQPNSEQLDIINTLAFYSETLIHGTPSGIDNTVSTYGGAVQYIKTKYRDERDVHDGHENNEFDKSSKKEESGTIFLDNFPRLHVILTNTNVPRSTRELVQGVKTLKEKHPDVVDPILDAIGNISRTFRKNIIQNRSTPNKPSSSQMKEISSLIQMNHSLLCALGVSHPSLNVIANLTTQLYNELKCSTKLTGAGGGGCAFTFLEDDDIGDDDINNCSSNSSIQERLRVVSEKIEALGEDLWSFQCFTSAVGGKGVLWM